jgi:hypothetical protein
MRLLIFAIAALLLSRESFAQGCCSGGSGSPVAGGTSQGVLADRQAEIAMNYQYINSDKFLTGDKPVMNFLKNYNTEYLYSRFAYGVTKSFTMSLESGYFLNKTQIGLGNDKVTILKKHEMRSLLALGIKFLSGSILIHLSSLPTLLPGRIIIPQNHLL